MNPQGNLLAWSDKQRPQHQDLIFDLAGSAVKRTLDVGSSMKLRASTGQTTTPLLLESARRSSRRIALPREWSRTLQQRRWRTDRMLLMRAPLAGDWIEPARVAHVAASHRDHVIVGFRAHQGSRRRRHSLHSSRKDQGVGAQPVRSRHGPRQGPPPRAGTQFTDDWIIGAEARPWRAANGIRSSACFGSSARTGWAGRRSIPGKAPITWRFTA